MSVGLVFGGGGAKGAYEVGVWWGLKEKGIDKDISLVSGASVGGLNAALFSMGSLSRCYKIWKSITEKDILCPDEDKRELINIALGSDSIFCQNCLKNIIIRYLDENKLRDKDCFISCTDVSRIPLINILPVELYLNKLLNLKAKYFNIRGLDIEKTVHVLLATSAMPFVYESIEIDGKKYCDGGICDNLPIQPLYKKGAETIIAVSLDNNTQIKKFPNADIRLIKPSKDLGDFFTGTMNFSKDKLERMMLLGYSDTLKYL